jgi:hypothetical protein
MSVADAAAQLQVSPRRIRAMIASNDISGERVGAQWMVDAASLPSHARRAGQPFSPRVAWAFMEVASGNTPDWVSASELSRLRSRWRKLQEDADPLPLIRATLARRAERTRWSAPEPTRVLHDPQVSASGVSDHRAGISAVQFAEAYVGSSDLDRVVKKHMLLPARGPENVVLRAVEGPVPFPVPWLAVVADLADGDARETQQAEILFRREAGRG